jgi:hypothetical protein
LLSSCIGPLCRPLHHFFKFYTRRRSACVVPSSGFNHLFTPHAFMLCYRNGRKQCNGSSASCNLQLLALARSRTIVWTKANYNPVER